MSHIMAFSIKCAFLLGSYKVVRSPRSDMQQKKINAWERLTNSGERVSKSWERVKFFFFRMSLRGLHNKVIEQKKFSFSWL